MRRIILGSLMIVGAGAIIVSGLTGAFFGDTETAVGNTFAAGAIDLKVDNESYYNGALNAGTTWMEPADLDDGLLFFNFTDLKPDDEGEDTISLHVNNNDAWACMDVSLTSNDDRSSTEPELIVPDAQEDINNTWDGELAQNIQMFWWADDGDNVYEVGENSISDGVRTLYNLATGTPFSVALADSESNVWSQKPGPIPAEQTVYLGKAWCFGNLTPTPLAQDGQGKTGTNGPLDRGTGFACDGKSLNNLTQTDGATLDVAFRAVQTRHNPDFFCGGTPRLAELTVIKQIVNDNGGNNVIADYQLFVVGTVVTPVTSGVTNTFAAGNYVVTESGIQGYQASFSGDCNVAGQVTLAPGESKTCTITNNDIPSAITLVKQVVGGTAVPIQFTMYIDGNVVPQNTSVPVYANSDHTITENLLPGYSFTNITGTGCPPTLPGVANLDEGESIVCTITNTYTP